MCTQISLQQVRCSIYSLSSLTFSHEILYSTCMGGRMGGRWRREERGERKERKKEKEEKKKKEKNNSNNKIK